MGYKARFKYKDIEWLVIDAFKYNGEKYMYLAEDLKEDIENEEDLKKFDNKIRIMYVKSVGDNMYEQIVDPALITELDAIVAKDSLSGKL